MNKEYSHFKHYPKDKWRWPHFKPIELRSKSDNKLMVDPASMDKLEALRVKLDEPILLTSAYRSPAHNEKVGGAKNSMHLKAKAFDCQMKNHNPADFVKAAMEVGFTGFGFYEKSGFIHIDTGPARTWGNRWFRLIEPDMAKPASKAPVVAAGAASTGIATIAAFPDVWPYVVAVGLAAIVLWVLKNKLSRNA